MSDKTRKAIAARLQRLAEVQKPSKPATKTTKETGGAQRKS